MTENLDQVVESNEPERLATGFEFIQRRLKAPADRCGGRWPQGTGADPRTWRGNHLRMGRKRRWPAPGSHSAQAFSRRPFHRIGQRPLWRILL